MKDEERDSLNMLGFKLQDIYKNWGTDPHRTYQISFHIVIPYLLEGKEDPFREETNWQDIGETKAEICFESNRSDETLTYQR